MTPTINVQVGREHQEQQQYYDSLWLFFMNCCCASTHVAHIMHMCQTMLSKFSNAVCAHRVRKVWKMARKQVRRAMQYLQNLYISAHTHFSIASTTTASICVFVFTTILLTFFAFVDDPTVHLCLTLSAQPFAFLVGIPPSMAACPFCATHAAGMVSWPTFLLSSKACA